MDRNNPHEQASETEPQVAARKPWFRGKPFWLVTVVLTIALFFIWRQSNAPTGPHEITDPVSRTSSTRSETTPPSQRKTRSHERIAQSQQPNEFDISKLREALENPNHDVGLNWCGRYLVEELTRTADYAAVGRFLATLPKDDAKLLLRDWVIGASPGLGSVADFDSQKRLIDDLGFANDLRLNDRFLREAGGKAFPELARNSPTSLQDARTMGIAVSGSAKYNGVKATLEAFPDLLAAGHAVPSIQNGVKWLLASDSTDASLAIGELPQGHAKDVMIDAMLDWLEKKEETSSMEAWVNQISDPAIQTSLREKHHLAHDAKSEAK